MMMARAVIKSTNIFATRHAGKQVLVYEAAITTAESNAMVLPIPVLTASTPVELLDLSAFPHLFYQLDLYYDGPPASSFGPQPFGRPPQMLEVFTVGAFRASIVPSVADFGRLDASLRLQPSLQCLLADRYGDYAFVVYQIGPGKHQLHPFGVAFESRWPTNLFFPTLHVHDGSHAPPEANFAHRFFAQGAGLESRKIAFNDLPPPGWLIEHLGHRVHEVTETLSQISLPAFVDPHRALDRAHRFGNYPNIDMHAHLLE
jgi:hypothetical protein